MKIIYLVRHAKAEEKTTSGNDFDRALTAEGIRDAETMGKRLCCMHVQPGIIISSPSRRTLQTANSIGKSINYSAEILFNENIYSASGTELIEVIKNTGDQIQAIMLVGHNPSFNELLDFLCKTNIENIPKAGIAGIQINVNRWSGLSHNCGTLLFFDSPKNK